MQAKSLIAGGGREEGEEVVVEGDLRELRLRVQERGGGALREGLLRLRERLRPRLRRHRHRHGTGSRRAAAPSGPPGREDGDGGDVAGLVHLKLHAADRRRSP